MADSRYLMLIGLVFILFVPLYVLRYWLNSISLRRYAHTSLLCILNNQVSRTRKSVKAILVIGGFVFIVVALCRPQWNPQPRQMEKQGRDVVILLDVSRSMLAQDVKPDRLQRAKLAIQDLIEHLEGDRISLVTFSGRACVKCPLTQDYAFLRLVLEDADTQSAGRGGTNLGDAIRLAVNEVFDNTIKEYKDIILISDGGDLEKSLPVEASRDAADKGVRIIAVGIGDETTGERIPYHDEYGNKKFLIYDNQEVWTRLDSSLLRECALSTNEGAYIPAGTNAFDLGQIYDDLIANAQKRQLEAQTSMQYEEKYQIFIILAIVLLLVEMFTTEKKKTGH